MIPLSYPRYAAKDSTTYLSSKDSGIATSGEGLLRNKNLELPWRMSIGASIGSQKPMHSQKPTMRQDITQFLK